MSGCTRVVLEMVARVVLGIIRVVLGMVWKDGVLAAAKTVPNAHSNRF